MSGFLVIAAWNKHHVTKDTIANTHIIGSGLLRSHPLTRVYVRNDATAHTTSNRSMGMKTSVMHSYHNIPRVNATNANVYSVAIPIAFINSVQSLNSCVGYNLCKDAVFNEAQCQKVQSSEPQSLIVDCTLKAIAIEASKMFRTKRV